MNARLKSLMHKFVYKLCLIFCIVLVCQISFAEYLDPPPKDPFFIKIEPFLDKVGIDVMQSWKSNVPTKGRATLALLADYPVTRRQPS
ncbi:MAG: hypothetical protein WCF67_02140, partial [Chitinophagaceae bacterium]